MLVKSIKLNNFRNYTNYQLEFDPHLNIIIGKNGVGKTNILEAIIVISNVKSFRTLNDVDLIKKQTEYSRIVLNTQSDEYKLVLNKNGKSLFINNNSIKKTSEFIGKVNAVIFKPGDLELFVTSPSDRRRIIDVELSKISDIYIDSLTKYKKLLADKNNLLKQTNKDEILLSLINNSMIEPIKNIIRIRQEFFEEINKNISNIYQLLSNTNSKIEIIYKKCSEVDKVEEEIERSKDKDNYYQYATFGPHHDDYYFKIDNFEINTYASQGQKRMVLIAFKFALVEYIKQITKKTPIILLDDILSELDKNNQLRLLNILPKDSQTIITNTDINNLNIVDKYKLIEIKEEQNA